MKYLAAFLLFAILALTNCQEDDAPRTCTAPGPLCETCRNLVQCIKTDDGYIKGQPTPCAAGETCHINQCTREPINQRCNPNLSLPFPCKSIGIFPHPNNCKKYIFCVPGGENDTLLAIPVQCEANYGYNPTRKLCNDKLVNNECPLDKYPYPPCSTVPSEPCAGDNNLYDICQPYSAENSALYPFQYSCARGGSFANYQCTDNP